MTTTHMATFEQTRNIMSIINAENISFDIILNKNTGKLFGKDTNGRTYRLSDKVSVLTADLSVSWFTPEDGEASWMIHPQGQANVVSTLGPKSAVSKPAVDLSTAF